MPAYNFQARFADAVDAGTKTRTIRNKRKHATKVGDTLFLYTGMRTKNCRLLRKAMCTRVIPISMTWKSIWIWRQTIHELITEDHLLDSFAQKDGWANWDDMITWVRKTHGFPWNAELIKWEAQNGTD